MKIRNIFILLLAIVSLCSCAKGNEDSTATESTAPQSLVTSEPSDETPKDNDPYISEKRYYKAIHYGDIYTCQVIDRGGYITKEFELPAEPTVELVNGNTIIKLTYGDLTDPSKTTNYYYDNRFDRSSREYTYVLDEYYAEDRNNLIVYFKEGVLYIRGMYFVNGEYYEVKVPLTKEVAAVDAPIISAEFIDPTTVTVTYLTADSNESFTESVSIAE